MKVNNKKLLLSLLILIISFSNIYSQSGWVWKSPYPQGNSITKIFTTPSGKLFGIGNYGTIISSTNGGYNWNITNKTNSLIDNFTSYFVYNDDIIFIGTSSGKILKTTDAGLNWNILCSVGNNNIINAIDFHDLTTGYVIYVYNYVYKTTNGGLSWQQVFTPYHQLRDIEFVSVNTGFVTSNTMEIPAPGIYKTTNGGFNWNPVYDNVIVPFYDLKFINSLTGFTSYSNNLLKTTNGGNNWAPYGNGVYPNLNTIFFFNELITYATFFGYNFKISSNGGYNWITKQMPAFQVLDLHFLNFSTGYLHGWNNLIYSTTNTGDNWILQTEPNGNGSANGIYYDCYFFNNSTGYTVGMNGLIKKTTNQGENWISVSSPSQVHYYGIDFINSSTGFIVGGFSDLGDLLKSTDGGTNWIVFKRFSSDNFNCIRFFNQNTGLIGCPQGSIYRTSDGGNNWNVVDSSLYQGIHSFYILNSSTGFAAGFLNNSTSKILKTTNSGLNWISILNTSQMAHLKFVNNNVGYCVGNGVLKTTDGGSNWFRVLNNGNVFGVDFVNENTGFISVRGSTPVNNIYRTTNGGELWNGLDFPSNGTIYALKFFNADTGIVFGEYMSILKTYNGGGNAISSVTNLKDKIPANYSLSQNYPNPFNPSTIIKFQIKDLRLITLKVYDILGKEVAVLVNEKLKAGEYETTFDGSGLPSGVYFYKLVSDDFTETKKMLMIK